VNKYQLKAWNGLRWLPLTILLWAGLASASTSTNTSDFDFIVKTADINNDGLNEIRLTPRNKVSLVFIDRPGKGVLIIPVGHDNQLKTLVLERYCIEKYDLPVSAPREPCLNICTSSLKVSSSRVEPEPYEYGVHWDYRACPITASSEWRIAEPVETMVLNDFGWKEDQHEFELLRGDFNGDTQLDFIIRSLEPGRASIRLNYQHAAAGNAGMTGTRNICHTRRRQEYCSYYCSSDGSVCQGEVLHGYYNISNSGAWFGDEGIELVVMDVNSDGVDDIRIFKNSFRLHDYLHSGAGGGSYKISMHGIDHQMVGVAWKGFLNALENNSPELAFSYVTEEFSEKYQTLFNEVDISAMASNWSEPVLIDLNNQTAVYAITQNENGREFVYTIIFTWDPNNGWVLHDL
jgi:hypothetical protein